MRLRSFRSCAGFRFDRFSSSGTSTLLDLHEMADLPQHACDHRALVVLGGAADLAEAERAQRAAVALGLADPATDLRQLQLRHRGSPPPPQPPAPQRAPPRARARWRVPRPQAREPLRSRSRRPAALPPRIPPPRRPAALPPRIPPLRRARDTAVP